MNIFILDTDPKLCAQYHCDRHVVKMILESCQLLCSVYNPGTAPYRRSFYNHPCSKWTRESKDNFDWLLQLAVHLLYEYKKRYNKEHKCSEVIQWIKNNPISLPKRGLTPFAQAMPGQYKNFTNPVEAYRNYYKGEKARFAVWTTTGIKKRIAMPPPSWWTS